MRAPRAGERTFSVYPQQWRGRFPICKGVAFYEPCSTGGVLEMSTESSVVIYERVRRREPFRKVLSEFFPYKQN